MTYSLNSLINWDLSVLSERALYKSSVLGFSTGPSRGILGEPLDSDVENRFLGAGEKEAELNCNRGPSGAERKTKQINKEKLSRRTDGQKRLSVCQFY